MKLYQILIGMVIIGLVSTAMYNFISVGVNNMDDPTSAGFDEELLQSFDTNANQVNSYDTLVNGENISVDDENRNDILGAIFVRGYQQAKSGGIINNTNRYGQLVSSGTEQLGILGGFADNLNLALSLIIVITIGVGLLLYFIIGKERV